MFHPFPVYYSWLVGVSQGKLVTYVELQQRHVTSKMALRRSESTHTTFSVFVTRKTKYQRWLSIINVLMLLGSLSILFAGLDLKLRCCFAISSHFFNKNS